MAHWAWNFVVEATWGQRLPGGAGGWTIYLLIPSLMPLALCHIDKSVVVKIYDFINILIIAIALFLSKSGPRDFPWNEDSESDTQQGSPGNRFSDADLSNLRKTSRHNKRRSKSWTAAHIRRREVRIFHLLNCFYFNSTQIVFFINQ